MWQRLIDHYEDPVASVTEIMETLDSLTSVEPEDYRKLTTFADTVESCYTQLAVIKNVDCITLLYVDKLSLSVAPSRSERILARKTSNLSRK